MAGNYLRGAFVSFMPTFLVPLPNVIVFQFNPETMDHTWAPATPTFTEGGTGNPLAVKSLPGETFSLKLALDANDMLADGSAISQGIATVSGVATQIAALEMLLYPTGAFSGGLLGSLSISLSTSGISISTDASTTTIPQLTVPATLFVWGPGRIVPVRISSLKFTEKTFDSLLNPTYAEATVGLTVMTTDDLQGLADGPLKNLCEMAYGYSQALRQGLATANLANSTESVIGMLSL